MYPFSFLGKTIDAQAVGAYYSLINNGYTVPNGLKSIDSVFKTLKKIYNTSDIFTAVLFFGDPSIAYQSGEGSGITLGKAIRSLPNIIDYTRTTDAIQTNPASQPLLLLHNKENYWWNSGIGENVIRTAQNENNDLLENFSIEAKINVTSLLNSQCIIGKWGGIPDRNFFFRINSGNLELVLYDSSEKVYTSTEPIPFSTNLDFFVRVSRNQLSGIIKFFTSLDGITYAQLGSDVVGITSILSAINRFIEIGLIANGIQQLQGIIYYTKLFKDDTFSTPTQIFDPNYYTPSISQTQFTSSTGEVYTINLTFLSTQYKSVLVDRTIIQGDGINDNLIAATVSSFTNLNVYAAAKVYPNSANSRIYGGSLSANNHALYGTSTNMRATNGGILSFFGEVLNANSFYTTRFNGASSVIRLNNANGISGDLGTLSSTGIRLFSDGVGANFSNNNLNSILYSKEVDTNSKETAMYNYIRKLNNNSF